MSRVACSAKIGMQNCKRSHDLNPPIEAKMSHDNLDSIGGFKSRDHLQFFCIPRSDLGSSKQPEEQHSSVSNQTSKQAGT